MISEMVFVTFELSRQGTASFENVLRHEMVFVAFELSRQGTASLRMC